MTAKIGLWNLESKIENTALMQISYYHKQQDDIVEWYSPLYYEDYKKIYVASLFDFTEKSIIRKKMIVGGTGFDIKKRLPPEIEASDLDYSLYPKCKTSYLWFSRGCIRNCPFCVVPAKEGFIKSISPKNLNPKGRVVTVMYNNFFATPSWIDALDFLKSLKQPIRFSSGIDVRTLDKQKMEILSKLRLHKRLYIAWDNPRENLNDKISELTNYIKPSKIMCYVLIGYWSTPEEDLMRVEKLRAMGVDPFVMPYNKTNPYQRTFARWVNHKALFKTLSWDSYRSSGRR